ncbi:MAG TPA: phospholipase D-like domain-containing protein [Solirubrobacteraceae bacterium]|nr:phospholipase D-like domain-containing protein [Solirubrobacteraceae bacterium]
MASFANGKVEAFVGPREFGAADDLEQVIVSFIEGARASLDVAVQELDSEAIAQALIDARWRGVSVRAFLEQDYLLSAKLPNAKPKANESEADARRRAQWEELRRPPQPKTNRDIVAALLRSNIDVKSDYNPAIFHQKFVIRDYRGRATSTSALLTGSANWTDTDCHKNLNHAIVFHSAKICAEYQREFDEIRDGAFGRRQHGDIPAATNIGGIPVKILFAPDHTPELELVKQMLRAKQRLDFAIFTFAGSSAIDDAMVVLRRAGVTLRGALDPSQGRQSWAATPWLHDSGIEVSFPKKEAGFGKLHHKLMVIDDAVVVAGSMNYTAPANEYNDENIFVLGSPFADLPRKEGGPVDQAACADVCAFFRGEIERIITAGERFAPA